MTNSAPVMNTAGRIGHSPGSAIFGGVFTVLSVPSPKVSACGLPVYRGPLIFAFSGGSHPAFLPKSLTAVVQQIQPTAERVTVDGLAPIRLGDKLQIMSCTGTLSSGGVGMVSGPVEIVDAGQEKVSAK